MEEKITKNNKSVIEIDIKRIWQAVWSRFWVVCLCAILSAIIALAGTVFFITPKYQSSTMFYVNNNSVSVGDASFSLTSSDITAAKSLVDTYIVILKSRACLNDVIDYAGVDMTYNELKDMISAASVNSTEIFEIVVTSTDPAEAETLAKAIAYILPKRISRIVEGTAANVVDDAVRASHPSSPSNVKNTVIGFLIGLFISVGIIAVREIFDTTIKTEEDLQQCCEHPILASVPDMMENSKSSGYYAYSNSKRSRSTKRVSSDSKKAIIGRDISFVASEAYKLLRTKLQFSFVDEITCPVIGVSSAMAGEGKSLTSINLAYSLSQLDKRVLLVDCDMRRPSLSTKLIINKSPGLSNYLTGHSDISSIIQVCSLDDEKSFNVVASGDNPPNPIELLSSSKMAKMIQNLKDVYDYIILDLPPVGEVSDAMVAAKHTDGILLVVRQDYCSSVVLSNAISQFEFIESRILGVVLNCVGESTGKYSRYGKGYYSKYSKYSKSYASAYARANKRVNEDSRRRKG